MQNGPKSATSAVIIGAGPGGLTAAIALSQVGINVQVFERAARPEVAGAGLALYPNATRVLATLGLGDAVAGAGMPIEMAEIRTWQGKVLTRSNVGRLSAISGAPAIAIHRADLQRILLEVAGQSRIQFGAELRGFVQNGDGVVASFADGAEVRADVLVGADGLYSPVRAQLLGATPPRYAGYLAWRGIASLEPPNVPAGCGFEAWGRGARFGMFRIGGGRVYWFATANGPEHGRDGPGGRKRDVLERFRAWAAPVPAIIDATDADAILRHDIYDREPAPRWSEGRVTLLGDAAHPMTPNLAQGAAQAIEDGLALATCLTEELAVVEALRRYERWRQPRTATLVAQSRRLGQVGQWEHPLACALRDRLVSLTPASITERQLRATLGI
jgi:2-polyprenyl-6-methoxyphenol hydroxylase-like FAD-dependent oxidoreductase